MHRNFNFKIEDIMFCGKKLSVVDEIYVDGINLIVQAYWDLSNDLKIQAEDVRVLPIFGIAHQIETGDSVAFLDNY